MNKLQASMIIVSCLLCAALAGCWGVTGSAMGLTPSQLLSSALSAHHRGDDRAFRTLLGRIIEESPESDEASLARTLLAALPPTDQGLLP